FIIPKFLIEDFQKKTNVNDEHIRNLSRKALDIISRLRENENIKIEILDIPKLTNYKDNLIQLAKQEHAQIITFDYEITKLGLIYGIKTLNLTELSISLKQAFLPGDELTVFVMKEGKDKNQGVAYLEDGTMVVVENGYSYIGKKTDVIVQSILKNSNGKIIFTKAK
ncbi:MAG: TRAM domain-containing protein, partial [Endomicrobia bacterium]|nr:TRAM domain-containing protein [Endomicrobiia bacterium]